MLCKEQGITSLGVNVLYDLIVVVRLDVLRLPSKPPVWRNFAARFLLMTLVALVLLYGRWTIMGSAAPAFQAVDNPASFSPLLVTRILTYNYIYSINALLLILPHWLCFDWSMGCIPLVTNWSDMRNLAPVVLWALLLSAAYQALFSRCFKQRRQFFHLFEEKKHKFPLVTIT